MEGYIRQSTGMWLENTRTSMCFFFKDLHKMDS